MPPFKVITKEPKDMSEAELQDLATFPASVYPITYGRAYRLILDRLAAEKLRADALHEALSELVDGIEDAGGHDENGDVFDIGKAVAALAMGGESQKASGESK